MIATNESISQRSSVRSQGMADGVPDQGSGDGMSAPENLLHTTKFWIERHPTTAVAASIAFGLLIGYLIKRRR